MNDVYISLTIKKANGNRYVEKAYLRVKGKKPQVLSPIVVCKAINDFESKIYRKVAKNKYVIEDTRVIRKLISSNVKHQNKKIATIAISTALAASLIVSGSKIFSTEATNITKDEAPNTKVEDTIAFNNPVESTKPEVEENTHKYTLEDAFEETYSDYLEPNVEEPTLDYDIFSYDHEDKSQNKEYQFVKENYGNIIAKYSSIYGVDSSLETSLISQENPYNKKNDTRIGARGITQIESVWWGNTVTAYNFEQEKYETVNIDENRLYEPEYAIKIGCMILNNHYLDLYNTFVTSGVLKEDECVIASLTAYNKGITAARRLIKNYGPDYINHRTEAKGGDNHYTERVLSYLDDGQLITFTNLDYSTSSVIVDNVQLDTFSR